MIASNFIAKEDIFGEDAFADIPDENKTMYIFADDSSDEESDNDTSTSSECILF
jgi:hypothetical protein